MIAATLMLLAGTLAAEPAPEPLDAKVELALQMMEASNVDGIYEQLPAQMQTIFQQQMQGAMGCDAAKETVEIASQEMAEAMSLGLDVEKLKIDAAAVMAEVFTEAELAELTAFYRSPIGRRMMEKMPEVMQKSMQLGQDAMKDAMPAMEAIMQRHGGALREAAKQCQAEKQATQ